MCMIEFDPDKLEIIRYPDPRLRTPCEDVTEFDASLAELARHMLRLMRAAKGVGLAAPQVGILKRMFVMNITGEPADDQVYVNPQLHDLHGTEEGEEGCLSIPGVHVQVCRATRCRIVAQDLAGRPVERVGEGLEARVWQHEIDHTRGILILDRMRPSEAIAIRRQLRELESRFSRGGSRQGA